MSKNTELSLRALAGGILITLITPFIPLLAWPMLIFDPLFPPECEPEVLVCLFSGKALFATLVSEVLVYSLVSYLVLKWRLIYLKRVSYIGDV
jgi:hypothetical protein